MKKLIQIFIFVFVIFFGVAGFAQAGLEHNVSGYAWSENIGWISFNSESDGSAVNYGVNVDINNGKISGYAWSENIGWISFEKNDVKTCPDGTDCQARVDVSQLGSSDVVIEGWARALAHGDGWDGWIRFDHGQTEEVYLNSSGVLNGWAWGDEVVGWISFFGSGYGATIDLSGVNQSPILYGPAGVGSSLEVSEPSQASYCGIAVHIFSWIYEDPDSDNESQFQLEVDNNNNFNSLEVNICGDGQSPLPNKDCPAPGTLSNPSPSDNSRSVVVSASPGDNQLAYNTQYYWRARVWDAEGESSDWVEGPVFTTGLHPYPLVSFNWLPNNPKQDEQVQFTDNSQVFGGATIDSRAWTFQDADPLISTEQNPIVVFPSSYDPGVKQISLEIIDSDGYSCLVFETINIKRKIPWWKELMGLLGSVLGLVE